MKKKTLSDSIRESYESGGGKHGQDCAAATPAPLAKHTQGPWRVSPYNTTDERRRTVSRLAIVSDADNVAETGTVDDGALYDVPVRTLSPGGTAGAWSSPPVTVTATP